MVFSHSAHRRVGRLRTAGTLVVAISLLSSCSGGGKSYTGPRGRATFDGPVSIHDKADIASMQARVQEKIASGYVFAAVGTVSSATISRDGSSTFRLNSAGDHVRLSLVPKRDAGDHIVI